MATHPMHMMHMTCRGPFFISSLPLSCPSGRSLWHERSHGTFLPAIIELKEWRAKLQPAARPQTIWMDVPLQVCLGH